MKNRFSKMGKSLLGAMCLLSTCGLTYSCSDDYDLDETLPSFLGGSIYDELNASGEFTTVVRLIDDLEYTDVLQRTGSKTLFVANDEAYEKFFAACTWTDGAGNPVRSYDQLSAAQKRLLLYSSMLNNADVLEMLSYSDGGGDLTMRRSTAGAAVDSVPIWNWYDLPNNLNEATTDEDGNTTSDTRFWDKYRTESHGSMYMALDATNPMMLHFTEEQMQAQSITHEDISFILYHDSSWANGSAGGNRTYVYGSQVTEQDVTCLNGYYNVLDTVLVTPPNMAEVIRTNGRTNLFSAMLDRFSAPYYSYSLTVSYGALYNPNYDTVFEKRYISSRTNDDGYYADGGAFTYDPDYNELGDFPFLTYDPGWNEYEISTSVPAEHDMGAMFVPTDDAMAEYFLNGGGQVLMERYATKENTLENLEYNLFQIPLDIIQALINNLMKDSFVETVPSKYLTITNDAQDQMFDASNEDYSSLENYKKCIDDCLLANNGVVYLMNRVITPADYASVVAPVLYSPDTRVVRAVIRADESYIDGTSYNNAPLQKYYSTYLKAMQSIFSFFVPTDEGLNSYGYIDPMSIARGNSAAQQSFWRYWRFTYSNVSGAVIPIQANAYKYAVATGQVPETDARQTVPTNALNTSAATQALSSGAGAVKRALLIDMLDQHILVHDTDDDDNDQGVNSKRTYYTSRGGAPIYVSDRGDQNDYNVGMVVDGGYQIQLKHDAYEGNEHDCTVTEGYDMTAATNSYGNGMTYFLDRPMQPTTKSVYSVMADYDEFSEFYNLCANATFAEDLLIAAGFQDSTMDGTSTTEQALWKAEQRKYRIFTNEDVYPATNEYLVRFFNNYRYTIYVPTNEAMQQAYANGLKTPTEITEYIEQNQDEEGNLPIACQIKAKAMITMLINFLKYHFQDEVLYVDNVSSNSEYQTSCIDTENNIYLTLSVAQTPNAITVTDNAGQSVSVEEPYNILARDACFNTTPSTPATSISYSSFVAIHQIPSVLNFMELPDGRYDSEWATVSEAAAFVKKFKIR